MGQQGQISLFRRFRIPAFGQKFRNILRRKIGVVFQKPFQILFIFLSAKRTGAVNQNAALFHIACRISQNFSLNFCQAVNLIAILFQADIRLFRISPRPEQGTSASTRSNCFGLSSSAAASFTLHCMMEMPRRSAPSSIRSILCA